MKNYPVNTLGFKELPYDVPSDAAEFDQLAGKVGACVDEANANIIYRGTLTDFRSVFLHGWHEGEGENAVNIDGIEDITGIKRDREVVKNAKGEVKKDSEGNEVTKFTETEETYFDRVLAQVANEKSITVDAARATFHDHALAVLAALPFDPKRKERVAAGPKTTPKIYQKIADQLVAQGEEQAKKTATNLTQKLGYQVDPTAESIGRAIAEDKRRQRKAEAAKLELEYA